MSLFLTLYVLPVIALFFSIRYMTKNSLPLAVKDAEDGRTALVVGLVPLINLILLLACILIIAGELLGVNHDKWYEFVFGKRRD